MYCVHCGASSPPNNRFCGTCGRPIEQQKSISLPQTKARKSHSAIFWVMWVIIAVMGLDLLAIILAKSGPNISNSKRTETPELSTQQVVDILFETFTPSLNMLNPGVNINTRRWMSFREVSPNCPGIECYYLKYEFQIIDPQGGDHDVECEWDVDVATRTATPRNAQATYYWMRK